MGEGAEEERAAARFPTRQRCSSGPDDLACQCGRADEPVHHRGRGGAPLSARVLHGPRPGMYRASGTHQWPGATLGDGPGPRVSNDTASVGHMIRQSALPVPNGRKRLVENVFRKLSFH